MTLYLLKKDTYFLSKWFIYQKHALIFCLMTPLLAIISFGSKILKFSGKSKVTGKRHFSITKTEWEITLSLGIFHFKRPFAETTFIASLFEHLSLGHFTVIYWCTINMNIVMGFKESWNRKKIQTKKCFGWEL